MSPVPSRPRAPRSPRATGLAAALWGLLVACGPPRDDQALRSSPPPGPAAPVGAAEPAQVFLGRRLSVDLTVSGAEPLRVDRTRVTSDDPQLQVLGWFVVSPQRVRVQLQLAPLLDPAQPGPQEGDPAQLEGRSTGLAQAALGRHTLTVATPGAGSGASVAVPLDVVAPLAVDMAGLPSLPRLSQGGRVRLTIRSLDPAVQFTPAATAGVLTGGARLRELQVLAADRLAAVLETDLDAAAAPDLWVQPGPQAAVQYLPAAAGLRIAPQTPPLLEDHQPVTERLLAPGQSALYQRPASAQARALVLRLASEQDGGVLSLLPATGRWSERRLLRRGPAQDDGSVAYLAVVPVGQPVYPVVQDGRPDASDGLAYALGAASFPVQALDLAPSEDPLQPAKLPTPLGTAYLPSQRPGQQAHYYQVHVDRGGRYLLAPAIAAQGDLALEVFEGGCRSEDGGKLRARSRDEAPLLALPLSLTTEVTYCVVVRPPPGAAPYSLLLTPAE